MEDSMFNPNGNRAEALIVPLSHIRNLVLTSGLPIGDVSIEGIWIDHKKDALVIRIAGGELRETVNFQDLILRAVALSGRLEIHPQDYGWPAED